MSAMSLVILVVGAILVSALIFFERELRKRQTQLAQAAARESLEREKRVREVTDKYIANGASGAEIRGALAAGVLQLRNADEVREFCDRVAERNENSPIPPRYRQHLTDDQLLDFFREIQLAEWWEGNEAVILAVIATIKKRHGGRGAGAILRMAFAVEPHCRIRATREPDSPLWSFYFLNDGHAAIDSADLVAVKYEFGDTYVGGESPSVSVAGLAPGAQALIWQDDGGSELRTDLWLRVTQGGQVTWLLFEFPKLYRQQGTRLIAHQIRMQGPPPADSDSDP